MKKLLLFAIGAPVFLLASCSEKIKVDLLVVHATIYTVDSSFSTTEALAITAGRIVETGTTSDLQAKYDAAETVDAGGKYIYPGFIDAHAHFVGYGLGLQTADLVGTTSWDSLLLVLKEFAATHKEGWLFGRGWDQNDWPAKEFPVNDRLNELFPDRPVVLERVDGHAVIVNQKAIEIAGLDPNTKLIGGELIKKNGKFTGVLIDNAMDLVVSKSPAITDAQFTKGVQEAEKNCFAVGLTTIDDCGLNYTEVDRIRSLQDKGVLKMRLYIMLSDNKKNFDYFDKNGIIKTDRLNVRSFKVYADGALGSRGACLLTPYADQPGHYGFLLSKPEHFDSVANWLSERRIQMCTHAIGDSGNRTMLRVYAKYLKGKNDLRWRIEHAQVINQNDFAVFGSNSIVPSVQPTHATSDMYWAAERLGKERVKGAYAYKELLNQNGWLPLGTDFPVEDISPFKTFFAAVIRKDAKGWPAAGFQIENVLSREEALRGMTIWAAKANFEEKEKGSLEKGKFADFVILDDDIMKADEKKLLGVSVINTYLNGTKVYDRNK